MEYENTSSNIKREPFPLAPLLATLITVGLSIHATSPLWRNQAYKTVSEIQNYLSSRESEDINNPNTPNNSRQNPQLAGDKENQLRGVYSEMSDYHTIHPVRE